KRGDFLFIEFTHNDQKPGGNHLDAFTTYKQTIKEWIKEARKKGMQPVLVTSMHRRNFDSTGHIVNTLGDYPEAMRQTAVEEVVPLIDLNAMSKTLCEAWGPEKSIKAFVHFPANTFPGQDKALADNTHFSTFGAYELAKCVANAIMNSGISLATALDPDALYDPVVFEKFYWPMSGFVGSTKPDGN
ncbi:MAG TPA: rhamnogalacturonan acetylesterase, partial [Niastella sp.]